MLYTLGGLRLADADLNRPVPLLLLAYLSVEGRGSYLQRARLARLFWPNFSTTFNDALGATAYSLALQLEEAFSTAGSVQVRLIYQDIARELSLMHTDVSRAKHELRSVHRDLERAGIITDVRFSKAGIENSTVTYALSKDVMRYWREEDSEDSGRRSLRVALHKLEGCITPSPIDRRSKQVRSLIGNDVDEFREALSADETEHARSLYKGHFLEGVEDWLLETRFGLSSALLEWIVHTRRGLVRDIQLVLLNGSISAYNRGDKRIASNFAHEALHSYSEVLLDEHELTIIVNLLQAGKHPFLKEDRILLDGQRFDVQLPTSTEDAIEALARDPRFRPSPTLPVVTLSSRSYPRHVAGPLPISRLDHFQGRRRELGKLRDVLCRERTRFVQLMGRSGVGKTTLIVKFLADLDQAPLTECSFSAINYTMFRKGQQYSLSSVVRFIFNALPPSCAVHLRHTWSSLIDIEEKLAQLFAGLAHEQRILLVWDSLETILDEDNLFPAHLSSFGKFVEACLVYDHNLTLLVSSRTPLDLSSNVIAQAHGRYGGEVKITEGLAHDESGALLRSLDSEGELGLREMSDVSLKHIYQMTLGHPRTLESIAGVLRKSPTLTLKKLVADRTAFEHLISDPAGELFATLSISERAVVDALAVYNVPVPEDALHYMLPFLEVTIPQILTGLVKNQIVIFNRNREGEFSLLSADQSYVERLLPERHEEQRLPELHRAAANYYLSHQTEQPWLNIDDVQPNLAAFRHLVRAEAFAEAFEVLSAIDYDYLRVWGYGELLVQLHQQLCDRLSNVRLKSMCLNALGRAHNQLGNFEEATQCFQEGLQLSSQCGDEELSRKLLANLGLAHYHLVLYDLAVMYFEEALKRQKVQEQTIAEQSYVGYLGLCHLETEKYDEAAACFREARAICEYLQEERKAAVWQGALAKTKLKQALAQDRLEHVDEAETLTKEALQRCHDIRFRTSEASNLDNLGQIYRARGNVKAAVALWLASHLLWVEVGSHYQKATLNELSQLFSQLDNCFELVRTLAKDGNAMLKEMTGISYTVFSSDPEELESTVRSWLTSLERDVPSAG